MFDLLLTAFCIDEAVLPMESVSVSRDIETLVNEAHESQVPHQ